MGFNEIKNNKEIILKIRKLFLSSNLSSRIISLIVHGSSIYKPLYFNEEDRDIDLELILTKPKKNDLLEIKNIIDCLVVKIECQLRYLGEIKKEGSLIFLSSYKIFYVFCLC
jgi:hypothetical protein